MKVSSWNFNLIASLGGPFASAPWSDACVQRRCYRMFSWRHRRPSKKLWGYFHVFSRIALSCIADCLTPLVNFSMHSPPMHQVSALHRLHGEGHPLSEPQWAAFLTLVSPLHRDFVTLITRSSRPGGTRQRLDTNLIQIIFKLYKVGALSPSAHESRSETGDCSSVCSWPSTFQLCWGGPHYGSEQT